MKKNWFLLLFLCLYCVFYADAQIVYHDAARFPLFGKATEATAERYVRLPILYSRYVESPYGI